MSLVLVLVQEPRTERIQASDIPRAAEGIRKISSVAKHHQIRHNAC